LSSSCSSSSHQASGLNQHLFIVSRHQSLLSLHVFRYVQKHAAIPGTSLFKPPKSSLFDLKTSSQHYPTQVPLLNPTTHRHLYLTRHQGQSFHTTPLSLSLAPPYSFMVMFTTTTSLFFTRKVFRSHFILSSSFSFPLLPSTSSYNCGLLPHWIPSDTSMLSPLLFLLSITSPQNHSVPSSQPFLII
jgi:hypothetical protein